MSAQSQLLQLHAMILNNQVVPIKTLRQLYDGVRVASPALLDQLMRQGNEDTLLVITEIRPDPAYKIVLKHISPSSELLCRCAPQVARAVPPRLSSARPSARWQRALRLAWQGKIKLSSLDVSREPDQAIAALLIWQLARQRRQDASEHVSTVLESRGFNVGRLLYLQDHIARAEEIYALDHAALTPQNSADALEQRNGDGDDQLMS